MIVSTSMPASVELLFPPKALPDSAQPEEVRALSERRAALRVLAEPILRKRLLVRLRHVSSRSGKVRALTASQGVSARVVLCMGETAARTLAARVDRSLRLNFDMHPGGEVAEAKDGDEEAAADEPDLPPPKKAAVEGLHARFLLEAFLDASDMESSRLQAQYDTLMSELCATARYLGLNGSAQKTISEQLGAISTLRDFATALVKCAAENAARDAEATREAKAQQAKLSSMSRRSSVQLAASSSRPPSACGDAGADANSPSSSSSPGLPAGDEGGRAPVREAWAAPGAATAPGAAAPLRPSTKDANGLTEAVLSPKVAKAAPAVPHESPLRYENDGDEYF